MQLRNGVVALAGGLFAASLTECTTTAAMPGVLPQPRSGAHSITMRTGWSAVVSADRRDSVLVTVGPGTTQLQEFNEHATFSLSVARDGTILIRLDSLSPEAGSPPGGDVKGTVWRSRISDLASGTLAITTGTAAAARYTDLVARILPRITSRVVTAACHWRDSATVPARVDGFQGSERRWGKWSTGGPLGTGKITIDDDEAFEQIAGGEISGQQMSMTAQGRRSATYYLNAAGIFDRANLRDSSAVLVSVPESHRLVPATRYSDVVLRFSITSDKPSDLATVAPRRQK